MAPGTSTVPRGNSGRLGHSPHARCPPLGATPLRAGRPTRLPSVSPYVVIAAVVVVGLLLFVAAMGARALLAPKAPTRAKLTTYESGVDPVGRDWAQTQVRYFVYAFLYVIFAVDAVYLFPWALVVREQPRGGLPGRDRRLRRHPAGRARARRPPRSAEVALMTTTQPTRRPSRHHCRCRGWDRPPTSRPSRSGSSSTGAAATRSGCSTSGWPAAPSSSSPRRWPGTTSSASASSRSRPVRARPT